MKCINKLLNLCAVAFAGTLLITGCAASDLAKNYETEHYSDHIYNENFISSDIAFEKEDVNRTQTLENSGNLTAAALIDVDQNQILYSHGLFDQLYPASTTKILTALVALKNADINDVVTITADADANTFAWDKQTCGIHEGDQMTLGDLLNGLLLHSGNDAAVAVADYIAGDVPSFAEMMNKEAKQLLATKTHFVNPNGLHDPDHYTTGYDLYLIFNECIQYPEFVEIISHLSYTASVTDKDGNVRDITWYPTNYYHRGTTPAPDGAVVVGGKTGTTDEAGSCLILLDETEDGHRYITIAMGAESKPILYSGMTSMINAISETN